MERGYSHRQRPKSSGGISHRTAAMRDFTAQILPNLKTLPGMHQKNI